MREHRYFFYITCSNSGTLYIGVTNSIYRRALQHKRGEIEGFSAEYGCNRLVYYESYDDVRKAIDREKQLKGWVRRRKLLSLNHATLAGRTWPTSGAPRWYSQANRSRTSSSRCA
jgi:putative endonuclease